MVKVKWKVEAAPTGPYRSFQKRGWPTAFYSNDDVAGLISCPDDYSASRVKSGDHALLTLSIADHSLKPRKWPKAKVQYKTLQEAKDALIRILTAHPNLMPKELQPKT